jgi:hypothetical protein
VRVEDARVRVVEDRRLDSPREKRAGLTGEELVERVVARDEDRESALPAPRASPLLPQRRDGAGEPDGDRTVEEPDVDPELERVGGRHSEQLALDEPPLDLAALLGCVAGPIRSEPARRRRIDPLAGEPVNELRCLAALGEADRAEAPRRELRQQTGGIS